MSDDRRDQRVRLPLLDRLLDDHPDAASDPPLSSRAALDQLRRSVRDDLEALLNARRSWRSWDAHLPNLGVSPVGFGIPDFAAGAFNEPGRREELRSEIEATIRRFEPRFARISVQMLPNDNPSLSGLRLRIEALLHAEPDPEPVSYESVLEPGTNDFIVALQEH